MRGVVLPGISELLDDVAAICQEPGINIEMGEDQQVHWCTVKTSG